MCRLSHTFATVTSRTSCRPSTAWMVGAMWTVCSPCHCVFLQIFVKRIWISHAWLCVSNACSCSRCADHREQSLWWRNGSSSGQGKLQPGHWSRRVRRPQSCGADCGVHQKQNQVSPTAARENLCRPSQPCALSGAHQGRNSRRGACDAQCAYFAKHNKSRVHPTGLLMTRHLPSGAMLQVLRIHWHPGRQHALHPCEPRLWLEDTWLGWDHSQSAQHGPGTDEDLACAVSRWN